MPELTSSSPIDHLVLAVDVITKARADRWVRFARDNGISTVKFGIELGTATSWNFGSELAGDYDIQWLADPKTYGIRSSLGEAIESLVSKDYPPVGITVPVDCGEDSLHAAQEIAGDIPIFGVTVLTTIGDSEVQEMYGISREELVFKRARLAKKVGAKGVVASANELTRLKEEEETEGLSTLICGTRSVGASHHGQSNVKTQAFALTHGADLVEIGREVTLAEDPAVALQNIIKQIEEAV